MIESITKDRLMVSIVVPVYNLAKYIPDLIKSVLHQTYDNWELIIVDDNSTDRTLSEVNKFLDDRIKVIKNKKNLGLSASRNIGIFESTGQYVQFLDGDDRLKEDALKIEIENLQSNPTNILHFDYEVVSDEESLSVAEARLKQKYVSKGVYNSNDALQLLFEGKIKHFAWSFIVSRDLLMQTSNQFPVGRLFEDFATVYRWIYAAKTITIINNKLYEYVQRKTSIMHQPNIKHAQDIYETVLELDDFTATSLPTMVKDVAIYELPRLLNAYGISLKSKSKSTKLTNQIRSQILKKVTCHNIKALSTRDCVKIIALRVNILKLGYILKNQ